MPVPHTPPDTKRHAFNCPHCHAYAKVDWFAMGKASIGRKVAMGPSPPTTPDDDYVLSGGWLKQADYNISICTHCHRLLIWHKGAIVHPQADLTGPLPADDLPQDIARDYEEARSILGKSPRGATALLRLCVQNLCVALGEKGKNINDDIGSLVSKGLGIEVKEAFDTLRVIGNNAVHPGELDLRDDRETAEALMGVLNYVVDAMITQPKKRKELFAKLPQSAKEAIAKRDGKKPQEH